MSEDALRRAVAEFVGAFTLIFIGAGVDRRRRRDLTTRR